MVKILIIENPAEADCAIMDGIFRLRHKVFCEERQWVPVSDSRMEVDAFDNLPPVHVAIVDNHKRVVGCLRMKPTNGPYMLRDVFPMLMDGFKAPESSDVWEISRFAVDSSAEYLAGGVSLITNKMLQAIFEYAKAKGVTSLLGVTDLTFERLLRRAGMYTIRYSPPRRLGNCIAVAGYADVTDELIATLRERGEEIQRAIDMETSPLPPTARLGEIAA